MARRVPLPNPQRPIPWAEQMGLEQIGERLFRSTAGTPFGNFVKRNGEQRPRAYGGHVYAQAAYAASKTVDMGFMIHSVTGYFTVLGLADEPFTYDVQIVRTGRGYCVRNVNVRQDGDETICFTCICSFKKTEKGFLNAQEPVDIKAKYASLLQGKEAEDLPIKADKKDWRVAMTDPEPRIISSFPGLYISVLPLEARHKEQAPMDRHHLYLFSAIGEASEKPDPNLEACAHLYHSDRESIWSILKQFELLDVMEAGSSLSHTVIFHVGADELSFHDEQGRRRWFYQETWSKRLSDGRGLHEGRIYNREGILLASTMQDGAIKLKPISKAEVKRREERIRSAPKL